jgi:hypothetical protein
MTTFYVTQGIEDAVKHKLSTYSWLKTIESAPLIEP